MVYVCDQHLSVVPAVLFYVVLDVLVGQFLPIHL